MKTSEIPKAGPDVQGAFILWLFDQTPLTGEILAERGFRRGGFGHRTYGWVHGEKCHELQIESIPGVLRRQCKTVGEMNRLILAAEVGDSTEVIGFDC